MAPPLEEKLMTAQRQNLQRSQSNVGWSSRNQSPFRSRQNFFLDLPFYRTQNGLKRRIESAKLCKRLFYDSWLCSTCVPARCYNPRRSKLASLHVKYPVHDMDSSIVPSNVALRQRRLYPLRFRSGECASQTAMTKLLDHEVAGAQRKRKNGERWCRSPRRLG